MTKTDKIKQLLSSNDITSVIKGIGMMSKLRYNINSTEKRSLQILHESLTGGYGFYRQLGIDLAEIAGVSQRAIKRIFGIDVKNIEKALQIQK